MTCLLSFLVYAMEWLVNSRQSEQQYLLFTLKLTIANANKQNKAKALRKYLQKHILTAWLETRSKYWNKER